MREMTRLRGTLGSVALPLVLPGVLLGLVVNGVPDYHRSPLVHAARFLQDGKELYEIACADCHGIDGRGVDLNTVGFDVPVPDFTGCSFSSREPDADWIAVASAGGPVRAFDEAMPSFGEALSVEQLQSIMDYIRGFCDNNRWPRGELNLPRPLITEKAYPEDEAVTTVFIDLDGAGSIINEVVYERRFGTRTQIELKLPFGFRETAPANGEWNAGIGDVTAGLKHVLHSSLERGSILSVGGEIKFPTGNEGNGFGKGTGVIEPFVTFGQILPGDAFLHLQGIIEFPTATSGKTEVVWRAALGRTLTQAHFGRTWSPMIEILGQKALGGGSADWDLVPQFQVTLNTRQHVMANFGVRIPVNGSSQRPRPTQLLVYVLWDWFDGGFFDGW